MSEKRSSRAWGGVLAATMAISAFANVVADPRTAAEQRIISEYGSLEAAQAHAKAVEMRKRMDEAAIARRAVAGRYASCEIVSVDDTQTSAKRDGRFNIFPGEFPMAPEPVTRNQITLQLKVEQTQESIEAERKYATDDTVTWNTPATSAGIVRTTEDGEQIITSPIPTKSKFTSEHGYFNVLGPTDTTQLTATTNVFPRTDRRASDGPMAVYLYTEAETWDLAGNVQHHAIGTTICGFLVKKEQPDGTKTWEPLTPPQVMPDVQVESVQEYTCNMIAPDPAQPNVFREDC